MRNIGYNSGIFYEKGKGYRCSFYACEDGRGTVPVELVLEDAEGETAAHRELTVEGTEWKKYQCTLVPDHTSWNGRLTLMVKGAARLYLDQFSLFPVDTYKGRKNGLRKDIAEMLADLKPKFMRFPGGCLVHDGSLHAEDHDSLYRWKNTIGKLEERPSRKSNWEYNQTLGLGYYEYFQFCEDIGAKPLPVLPAGYDPHHQRMVPQDKLEEWVQEALDLIEFANGDETTTWGKVRAELGHAEPFHLEYIGIGNEEVGEGFFERYPYFHKAIKKKYPKMKIIASSGPFAAGGEYEKGWACAEREHADYVDEHYYQAPEWFLANHHRYDLFDEKRPKVFLGEFASWGNTWYNALLEASYMIGLERNAGKVGLACYAPLLCNVDYCNWKPDMIWFDNHRVYGTANYYVQKLFMNHQGDTKLEVTAEQLGEAQTEDALPKGWITINPAPDTTSKFFDIRITIEDTGEEIVLAQEYTAKGGDKIIPLMEIPSGNYTVELKAQKLEGRRGFHLSFGKTDEENKYSWELGGWQNMDCALTEDIHGRNSCLTQSSFSVELDRIYELRLEVRGCHIRALIDGDMISETENLPVVREPFYYSAAKDREMGDVILKLVNVTKEEKHVEICLKGMETEGIHGIIYEIKGVAGEAENSFEEPEKVSPSERECYFPENHFLYVLQESSVAIIRMRS